MNNADNFLARHNDGLRALAFLYDVMKAEILCGGSRPQLDEGMDMDMQLEFFEYLEKLVHCEHIDSPSYGLSFASNLSLDLILSLTTEIRMILYLAEARKNHH